MDSFLEAIYKPTLLKWPANNPANDPTDNPADNFTDNPTIALPLLLTAPI